MPETLKVKDSKSERHRHVPIESRTTSWLSVSGDLGHFTPDTSPDISSEIVEKNVA